MLSKSVNIKIYGSIILPVVCVCVCFVFLCVCTCVLVHAHADACGCGCVFECVTLRDEHWLRVFKNTMKTKKFWPKGEREMEKIT